MSKRISAAGGSSTSAPSAKSKTPKIHPTAQQPEELSTGSGEAKIVSNPSNSPLASLYQTEAFRDQWNNSIAFHVASNLLFLRRFRGLSQQEVAKKVGTSQPAIARIEGGQENITLETLQRLTEALQGSFFVSIKPRECVPYIPRPWWENQTTTGGWSVRNLAFNQTQKVDQVIVGLERPHVEVEGTHITKYLPGWGG